MSNQIFLAMGTNRRDFLKTTGIVTLGSIITPEVLRAGSFYKKTKMPGIGIQTFTLSSFMGKDVKATFKKLSEIGFKNLETASYEIPYYGYKPRDLKAMIEDLGMKWIGNHVPGLPLSKLMVPPKNATPEQVKMMEDMRKKMAESPVANLSENMQKLIDDAAEGGLQYLICAATAIRTLDEIKVAIETFSKTGEACKKAGIQFAYHNHATEWDPVEGKTAYDLILSQTNKDLVKMELDLGWVATAKKNPVELFKGNPGRFPLWHVKDFNLTDNTIVPIGKGTIDFRPAFANADLAGMKYFFYEQDTAKSMDEVQLSYNNLKKIL
jgi:sugar phosphate isomerase/epimerase